MNDYILNSQVINKTTLTWDLALDTISYDNYWLQNSSIIIEWEWFWLRDYADVRINMIEAPQTHGQIYNNSLYWWKTINIQWVLKASNKTDLDTLIDEFKLKLSIPNKYLKWKVKWEVRKIKATLTDLTFWTKENIYIKFNATFKSQNAFWIKNNMESILIETHSWNLTEDITNEYLPTRPMFIIGIKTWNITSSDLKSNWIWLSINTSFTAGDVLIIDWINLSITKNWVEIDYNWIFPELLTWGNQLTANVVWTYTADISIVYQINIM